MPNEISFIYIQFFGVIAIIEAFAWGLMTSPLRIAPKASRLFSLANLCMFFGMVLYFYRSDPVSYLHWYFTDMLFTFGFCLLRWGGLHLFKQKLTYQTDLTIFSLTILLMLLIPPQVAYASYLMAIASFGASLLFFFISKDNYQAIRKSLSIFYSLMLTLPFILATLFFISRFALLLIFTEHQPVIETLTTLKSPVILWAYIGFILSINCVLFGNALTRLVYKIHKLAKKDQLTGLWNRHALMTRLDLVDALWHREHQAYSLLLLDLDHFKRINDTYGHLCGDAALQHVATILQRSLRKVDFICRFGGEEFLIILPATDAEKAYFVAEKLQAQINQNNCKWQQHTIEVQVSIGYATIDQSLSVEQLLQLADEGMYCAKQQGRNTISTLTPPQNTTT